MCSRCVTARGHQLRATTLPLWCILTAANAQLQDGLSTKRRETRRSAIPCGDRTTPGLSPRCANAAQPSCCRKQQLARLRGCCTDTVSCCAVTIGPYPAYKNFIPNGKILALVHGGPYLHSLSPAQLCFSDVRMHPTKFTFLPQQRQLLRYLTRCGRESGNELD